MSMPAFAAGIRYHRSRNLDGDTVDKCLVQVDVADEFLFLAPTTLPNHDREIGEVATPSLCVGHSTGDGC